MTENNNIKISDKYKISVQLGKYDDVFGQEFKNTLSVLQKYKLSGVELNLVYLELIDPIKLKDLLNKYDLKMTMLASGAMAKLEKLSLSDSNEDIRFTSIERLKSAIEFASKLNSGIIFGFIKGGISQDKTRARELFKDSISRLEGFAYDKKVPLLIEATNRYETSVANSVKDTVELFEEFNNPYLRVLPDTFHMNIEESNISDALIKYFKYYDSIHISDNNRFFPGHGALDFASLFKFLKAIGYKGGIAIEGNNKLDLERDLNITMNMIDSIQSRI